MADEWTLKSHPVLPKGKPVLVCILDGYGENAIKDEWNAVHVAKTPNFDKLRENPARFRAVAAHGPAVGLPSSDDMGNSEVGHNALGAGKIYAQGAKLVDINIASGQIYTDPGWKYISTAFETNTLHFIGLLSDGGVHSRYNQLSAMAKKVTYPTPTQCHSALEAARRASIARPAAALANLYLYRYIHIDIYVCLEINRYRDIHIYIKICI